MRCASDEGDGGEGDGAEPMRFDGQDLRFRGVEAVIIADGRMSGPQMSSGVVIGDIPGCRRGRVPEGGEADATVLTGSRCAVSHCPTATQLRRMVATSSRIRARLTR